MIPSIPFSGVKSLMSPELLVHVGSWMLRRLQVPLHFAVLFFPLQPVLFSINFRFLLIFPLASGVLIFATKCSNPSQLLLGDPCMKLPKNWVVFPRLKREFVHLDQSF